MAKGKSYKFPGTTISTITGYGVPVDITAISRANPAVVSATAHGLETGGLVRIIEAEGMTELNDRVYVVESLTAGTFALLDIDTTQYDAYTGGGSFEPATLAPFCELTGYDESTGSTQENTNETICSTEVDVDFGLPDPGSVTMNFNYAPTSGIQQALEQSRRLVQQIGVVVQLPNKGGRMVDIGVVTQRSSSGATGGAKWSASATLRRQRNRIDVAVAA